MSYRAHYKTLEKLSQIWNRKYTLEMLDGGRWSGVRGQRYGDILLASWHVFIRVKTCSPLTKNFRTTVISKPVLGLKLAYHQQRTSKLQSHQNLYKVWRLTYHQQRASELQSYQNQYQNFSNIKTSIGFKTCLLSTKNCKTSVISKPVSGLKPAYYQQKNFRTSVISNPALVLKLVHHQPRTSKLQSYQNLYKIQ